MAPTTHQRLRVVVDLAEPMSAFFTDVLGNNPATEEQHQLAGMLTQVSDFDLLEMSQETINNVICEGGHFNGISYTNIANLRRFATIREILYPTAQLTYRPTPTATESYHMSVLEDQMSRVFMEFYGAMGNSIRRDSVVEVVMWRTITALVLTLCQAFATIGLEKNISEMGMINYHCGPIELYGSVHYTYVVSLTPQ